MATLILSAAGAALGAKFGGAVLGLSGAVIGRAVGATLGRVIDQKLLGRGGAAVETGRIDRLRVASAGEGVAIPRLWGRMRLAGHVIWASAFREVPGQTRRVGGKFGPKVTDQPTYSVSLALALAEGPIDGVGRIWADGVEIDRDAVVHRIYPGSPDQLPDPAIAAIEGADRVPAYRGTAYVVFEDLDLSPWGNRIPNFSFEVIRAARAPGQTTLQEAVRAVAWLPGSGEYALATRTVTLPQGPALGLAGSATAPVNRNTPSGRSDLDESLSALAAELPSAASSLLIASWFGSDLRCGACRIEPKVEFADRDSSEMPWTVSGRPRAATPEIARLDDAPVYGGTPADAAVLEAIAAMKAAGQAVVFYPFILMEQLAGNGLPDPYGGDEQAVLPWRGRITLSVAPGRPGSPDRTAAAEVEVAAFFGTVTPAQFTIADGTVTYTGPADEWSYRRFILHYAALCAAAGGVDAFCIGSEMRGLTTIRGAGDSFPAVARMVGLLEDVRAILGPEVKLTYAADWSEYFGYQDGTGGRYFHLDPLWAHPDCDAIGIDNYMPLSDWRDAQGHLDGEAARSIYDLDYLKSNIAGGEGFDWFYAGASDRRDQFRTPITDAAENEPWVWRYKDLLSWWSLVHYDRPDGVRAAQPTSWAPRSKPIWFTELGCAAIDKGTNQPNVFLDAKSSESAAPHFSTGRRDDLIQMQYLRAMADYWTDPANNPVSDVYDGPMVDWSRAHVWAWDARPWPWFPANAGLWSDGPNWLAGHWITGRATNQPLAAVVAEICQAAGLEGVDVSGLHGVVRGYAVASTATARAALQPLMLAHGIEAVDRGGRLVFRLRDGRAAVDLDPAALVAQDGGPVEISRAARAEQLGRVRLTHIEAEGSFETRAAEAVLPDEPAGDLAETELPLTLLRSEARAAVTRWLAEARIARDVARFALPPSSGLGPGDVVTLPAPDGRRHWRIDRMDLSGAREVEAVRVEPGPYGLADIDDDGPVPRVHRTPGGVAALFLDLPLMQGDEVPQAPHLAALAQPWPGRVAAWRAPPGGGDIALAATLERPAAIGVTETALARRRPALWHRGQGLVVRLPDWAELSDRDEGAVLDGANLLALGAGADWELVQYAGALLLAPGLWELRGLIRGQFGTDAVMPDLWPAGTLAVPVGPALVQVDLPLALRNIARLWRIGAATLAPDDPLLVERVEAFRGVGLRPYAPAHLRARRQAAGWSFGWRRRTRIGGDSWDDYEVPLGEESERYLLRVVAAGQIRREIEVTTPDWTYPDALRLADGVGPEFELRVAQISGLWGPGPAAAVAVSV